MSSLLTKHNDPGTLRLAYLVTLLGLGLLASPAHGAGSTYIEAIGASIHVQAPAVQVQGEDSNPLLNPAAEKVVSEDENFANTPVSPASNVYRTNNVPSYADKTVAPKVATVVAAPNVTRDEIQAGANVPRTASASNNSVAASGGGLPSPKINFYDEVLTEVAPMDTNVLREVIQEIYTRQGAAVTPANPGMRCRSTQYMVDLSPGATPPVVRVSKGVGAIINFTDMAGNPWPVTFARNFHSEAAQVTQMAPHVISAASVSPHLSGSVGVVLEDLTTPVSFIVTPGQEETDCRVDLRIPGMAPGATAAPGQISNRPGIAQGGLMDFMYGATPEGATRLTVQMEGNSNNTTRAWQDAAGKLVLRTAASVISPGWYQSLPALDGTTVYQLPPTSVVNASVDGEARKIVISGLVPVSSKSNSETLKMSANP